MPDNFLFDPSHSVTYEAVPELMDLSMNKSQTSFGVHNNYSDFDDHIPAK